MNDKRLGRQTVALAHPPSVLSFSNIGGKFEGQGPLADFFDEISNDSFFGEKTWEKAECHMQEIALETLLQKAKRKFRFFLRHAWYTLQGKGKPLY